MFLPAHNRYSPFDPDLRSLSIFPFTRSQLWARWKTTSWSTVGGRGEERGTGRSPISPSTVYTWALAISHDTFPVVPPRTEKGERWIEWKGYLPVLFEHSSAIRSRFQTRKSGDLQLKRACNFSFQLLIRSVLLNLSRIIYNASCFLQQDGRFSYKLDRYFSIDLKKNRPISSSCRENSYKFLSIDVRTYLEVDGRTTSVKSLASLNHKLLATIPQPRPTNKIGAETREMKGR